MKQVKQVGSRARASLCGVGETRGRGRGSRSFASLLPCSLFPRTHTHTHTPTTVRPTPSSSHDPRADSPPHPSPRSNVVECAAGPTDSPLLPLATTADLSHLRTHPQTLPLDSALTTRPLARARPLAPRARAPTRRPADARWVTRRAASRATRCVFLSLTLLLLSAWACAAPAARCPQLPHEGDSTR